jgi:Fur family ferric uptake transcriptional regulator
MSPNEKLRSVGLKATPQRLKVLQVFHVNERRFLNAEEVYRHATQDKADIGRATVYRTLGQLTEVGILDRTVLDSASGIAVYQLHDSAHYDTLVCLRCDRIDSFVDETIELRKRAVAAANGYALQHHRLTLYGFCTKCRTLSLEGT